MTQLSITTTQNVNIFFKNASLGERMLAFIIDLIIKVFYITAISYVFDKSGFSYFLFSLDYWSRIAVNILIYCPAMFYTLLFEVFMEGRTPGKRILKIKVIKIDGYQAKVSDYLIRWVFNLIDIYICSGALGVISIVISGKNQRIGDIVAGTAVISLREKTSISQTIFREIETEYKPIYPQVVRLSDDDVRIIKEAMISIKQNNDLTLLNQLTLKIEQVTGVKNKSASQLEFINTVLNDYNHLTLLM